MNATDTPLLGSNIPGLIASGLALLGLLAVLQTGGLVVAIGVSAVRISHRPDSLLSRTDVAGHACRFHPGLDRYLGQTRSLSRASDLPAYCWPLSTSVLF